jgi:hypothetical protein
MIFYGISTIHDYSKDLIHYFRLGLGQEQKQPRTPGLLTGKLGDAFFEPLSEEELQAWE